ncbi:MAG: fibronectin type III domain-containing protein, partial [Paludibacter sp.]
AAKITSVNAITLAGLALAPLPPAHVKIGGAVSPSTTLAWDKADDLNCIGYKIYWRDTTSPQWQYSRFVGKVNSFKLENIIIDNYFFGVAAVGKDGNESLIVFPNEMIR